MRYQFAVLGLALLTVPFSAQADWEGTHWGDSPEAVIAATGARADQGTTSEQVWGQDQRATRIGDYNGISAKWLFFFNAENGLSVVKIRPVENSDCSAFMIAAESGLGRPVRVEKRGTGAFLMQARHWDDQERNLSILSFTMNSSLGRSLCHIIFQPFGSTLSNRRD